MYFIRLLMLSIDSSNYKLTNDLTPSMDTLLSLWLLLRSSCRAMTRGQFPKTAELWIRSGMLELARMGDYL